MLHSHCVKSVRIRSYSGPYIPAFGLNTEGYEVSLRVQSECGKIQIRITPTTDIFYAVSLISNLLTASSKKLHKVCAIFLLYEITIFFSIRVIPVELIFSRMFCYFININIKQTSIFKILISQRRLFHNCCSKCLSHISYIIRSEKFLLQCLLRVFKIIIALICAV